MIKLTRAKPELKTCIYATRKGKTWQVGTVSIHDDNCGEVVLGVQGSSAHFSSAKEICCCGGIKSNNNSGHITVLLAQDI